VQRPFTIDGVLGCGSGFEPGMAGVEKVPPWWVPVSFATATQLDITWQPLESCSSKEPIYTLQVGRNKYLASPNRRLPDVLEMLSWGLASGHLPQLHLQHVASPHSQRQPHDAVRLFCWAPPRLFVRCHSAWRCSKG